MFLLEAGVIAVVVVAAVLLVTRPLRGGARATDETLEAERAELEASKEAKYREIRDAELDREQGKLSQDDWARIDAELRREAIALLKQLDAARGE